MNGGRTFMCYALAKVVPRGPVRSRLQAFLLLNTFPADLAEWVISNLVEKVCLLFVCMHPSFFSQKSAYCVQCFALQEL